jgi:hypothetical protein
MIRGSSAAAIGKGVVFRFVPVAEDTGESLPVLLRLNITIAPFTREQWQEFVKGVNDALEYFDARWNFKES